MCTFIFQDLPVFIALHSLRFIAVAVATRILAAADPATELLLVVPYVAEACLYAGIRPGAVVGGLLVLTVSLADLLFPSPVPGLRRFLNAATLAAVGGAVTGLCALVISYREKLVADGERISELHATARNLFEMGVAYQSYANKVRSDSVTEERNRITRELHDTVGHALTSIMMAVDAASVLADSDLAALPGLLRSVRGQAHDALSETRRTLHTLRSMEVAPRRGLPQIAELGRAFEGATGVAVEIHYGNLPLSLGAEIDAALYRLVQEGLTNAFRHGGATKVRLVMSQGDGEIRASLCDNGRGAGAIEEGIGLRGMRERFAALGGSLEAVAGGGGFELRATIPRRST